MTAIRVVLPAHLRTLAGIDGEVVVEVDGTPTITGVLDAVEARHPVLCGTIRDQRTLRRRPFMRYFACEEDLSGQEPSTALPAPIAAGREPFRVVAAIAGG